MYLVLAALLVLALAYKKYRSSLRIDGVTRRHVFITGCDSGFGLMLAKSLDKLGVFVYAGCLKHDSVQSLHEQCSSKLKALQVDITNTEDVARAAKFVEEDLKGNALWGIVNNAGIGSPLVPFDWTTKADAEKVFAVNVFGAIDVALKFLPLMKRGREGRIVNVSSMTGRIGIFDFPYSFSKYAVEGLSDGLAFGMARFNITCHVIEPAGYRTQIINPTSLKAAVSERWRCLDPITKQSYGDDFLQEKSVEMDQIYESSSDKLHEVPDAITHALLARHPRERYPVGVSLVMHVLFFLPVWVQMAVLLGKSRSPK